jgi:hypothetical protein
MLNVNRQQTSNDGKSSNGLWLGELEKGNFLFHYLDKYAGYFYDQFLLDNNWIFCSI